MLAKVLVALGLVTFLVAGNFAVALPETPKADFLAPTLAAAGALLSLGGYVAGREPLVRRLAVCGLGMNAAAVMLLAAALF